MAIDQVFRRESVLLRTDSHVTSQTPPSSRTAVEAGRILIADSNASGRSAIRGALDNISPNAVEVENSYQAISAVSQQKIDLVIVSQDLPEIGGAEVCRILKQSAATQFIPVFVLARTAQVEDEVAAIDAGADEFIDGPIRPAALRARIRSRLRYKAMVDSLDESETVLFSLAQSIEDRDSALGAHCERLVLITSALGMRLGLSKQDLVTLERAAYLHDIGKVGIPDSVLFKPGPLSEEEWVIMRSHAERGERICSNIRSLVPVLPLIRHHHEKWNGTGYPDHLKGEEIPLLARVLQVADIYDALTTSRPYKKAFSPDQAYEIMLGETAKGWLDPKMMETFGEVLPLLKGTSVPDIAKASLQALANSIERLRKTSLRTHAMSSFAEPHPVRLASGL